MLFSRLGGNAGPIAPVGTAALSGTITSATEQDIVDGGKTIVLTLTNDTFVASGATFNAQRQAIIDGLTSAQSEANGWNNVVKAGLAVTAVVRTSDTVVTITLPAFASYSVTANETITATLPAAALTLAAPIVAAPTFTITEAPSWTSVVSMNAGNYTSVMSYGNLTNVTDDGTYVRMTYWDGMPAGQAPNTLYKGWAGSAVVRMRVVGLRLSSDPAFYIQGSGNNKFGFFLLNTPSAESKFVPQTFGQVGNTGTIRLGFDIQSAVSGNGAQGNSTGPLVTRGTVLDEIIWEVGRNSAGTADGYAKLYYNGVLAVSKTDIQWATGGTNLWNEGQWAPVLGGNGGSNVGTSPVVPALFYEELQEFHIEVPA